MKKLSIYLFVVCAAVLLVSAGAFAAGMGKEPMKGAQAGMHILGSNLIGKSISNPQDENIGKIEDILLDQSTGRISVVLVDTEEKFLDIGEKLVAVPFQALTPSATGEKLVLSVDKERLANAPSFNKDELAQIDRTSEGEIYRFFGVSPYWEETPSAPPMREEPMMREPGTMQPGMPPGHP